MKRYLVAAVLGCLASIVSAQGYVGAVRSLTNVGYDCPAGLECDKKSQGWKFYGGTKLPSFMTLDLGFAKVDSFEVGYMRFGKTYTNGAYTPVTQYNVDQDAFLTSLLPVRIVGEADAISLAIVGRAPIVDQFAVAARLGLAYVASTLRTEVDGRTFASETKNKIQPYLGLGFEYDIPSILKVTGSFDMTKIDVDGTSASIRSSVRMIGLGVEKSF
jgi:hypothetical protein